MRKLLQLERGCVETYFWHNPFQVRQFSTGVTMIDVAPAVITSPK
ncbi:Uncharacterised protein [Porphyromonas macacae]|uniref:Uncharacterized protein n=1 Tax=Porphyromonas macacae TaxID=28115 RepID=A0A379E6E2_9PORP|nr:Uncharacterised protein [Porphyromonas macacae]